MVLTDTQLYEAVYDRKWVKGYKWKHIAEALGFDIGEDGMQVKYKRLAAKLKLPYKPEQLNKPAPVVTILPPIPSQSSNQDPKDMTDLEIFRIKYEELLPTFYVSELSNDDWIDKYMEYPLGTNDPELVKLIKKDWRQPYLTELRDNIWNKQELIALLPRGYGKTESVIALFIRWILEVRKPLMIITPKRTHSKKIMRAIERALKRPCIRRDYGDVGKTFTYSSDGMILDYVEDIEWKHLDYPVEIYTFSSIREGAHPAWIHFEDVMQREFKNIESNEDLKEKHTNTIIPMLGKDGKFTVTGTRYGMNDFYEWLMIDQGIPLYHRRALNEDGTWMYCPRFTLEHLLMRKQKMPAAFETQMNNNPVPSSGLYFDREEWQTIDDSFNIPATGRMGINYYMALDPAVGLSENADNTAIIVVAIYEGKMFVVDGYVGKLDFGQKLDKFMELYRKYLPSYALVEKIMTQQMEYRKLKDVRGVIPYSDTRKNAKLMRISAMKPYFTEKSIYIKTGIQPYTQLFNEYLAYKETQSTSSTKDDTIDALSMLVQEFGKYLDREDTIDGDGEWEGDWFI